MRKILVDVSSKTLIKSELIITDVLNRTDTNGGKFSEVEWNVNIIEHNKQWFKILGSTVSTSSDEEVELFSLCVRHEVSPEH